MKRHVIPPTGTWRLLVVLTLFFVLRAVSPVRAAPAEIVPSPPVDQQLLEGELPESLDDELFKELDIPSAEAGEPRGTEAGGETADDSNPSVETRDAPPADPSADPLREQLDRLLEQQLKGEGEAATGDSENRLDRAGTKMRLVEEQLGQEVVDGETLSLQEQIVADLAAEIAELQRRKNKKPSSKGEEPRPQQSRRSRPQPQPGPPQQAGSPSENANQPARDSSDSLRDRPAETPDLAQDEQLMKDLWGHLPQRVREQMLQGSGDLFLPKYQGLIEEYFKRLLREQRP